LNQLVRNSLLQGFGSKPPLFHQQIYTTQFQQATNTLYQLQDEIFFTVPQHVFNLPRPDCVEKVAMARAAHPSVQEAVVPPQKLSTEQRGSQRHWEDVLSVQQSSNTVFHRPLRPKPPLGENSPTKLPLHIKSLMTSPVSPDPLPAYSLPINKLHSMSAPPYPSLNDKHRKPTITARTYGGNFLMWPLYFAGRMDNATDEVRAFAIRNLRDIGNELGIKQGWVLADLLEKNAWTNDMV